MKISARNQLKGKVVNIIKGAVNSEITIQLPEGTEIVSVITRASVDAMKLKIGSEAYAVFKSSSVMIAVD